MEIRLEVHLQGWSLAPMILALPPAYAKASAGSNSQELLESTADDGLRVNIFAQDKKMLIAIVHCGMILLKYSSFFCLRQCVKVHSYYLVL
jgi:hypothetical protein